MLVSSERLFDTASKVAPQVDLPVLVEIRGQVFLWKGRRKL